MGVRLQSFGLKRLSPSRDWEQVSSHRASPFVTQDLRTGADKVAIRSHQLAIRHQPRARRHAELAEARVIHMKQQDAGAIGHIRGEAFLAFG